eukprot:CAMPEP_0118976158 /NCGR_PEP_ID=MMETSP1173-20130426/17895_1 /TAXON_ID=1034831 /ORGANISM="Rhizochromulina marina cf, Strain CCMP1243" /LENGTH=371 /DNA_ID=CAMNT_0006926155 /DNA_START=58 /DNA_END=1173 /DNA_ORIENTATION=-
MAALAGAPARQLPQLQVGDEARAYWKSGRKLYRATVEGVNGDGTFSLRYEDGDEWDAVPMDFIRRPDGSTMLPSMDQALASVKTGLKHGVSTCAVDPAGLDALFPAIKAVFRPQVVKYSNTNPSISMKDGKHGERIDWKVSSYMEVDEAMGGAMQRNVTVNPGLLEVCTPLLEQCNRHFSTWYQELHGPGSIRELVRLQSFITRYRPLPNENALLRHIDGAHVDGSVILALPTDMPFEGGGVTVWEGDPEQAYHYSMGPGDMCFLDNYVWHQGNPITAGERWSLVIFYAVSRSSSSRLIRIIQQAAQEKTGSTHHENGKPRDPNGAQQERRQNQGECGVNDGGDTPGNPDLPIIPSSEEDEEEGEADEQGE